jgi:hypothetical protein
VDFFGGKIMIVTIFIFYWKLFSKKKYRLFFLARKFFELNKHHTLYLGSADKSAINFVPSSLRIKEIRKKKLEILNNIERN